MIPLESPVAVETLGVIGPDSLAFLHDLVSRIRKAIKEPLALQNLSLSNAGMPLPSAAQLSGTPARSPRAFDLLVINTIIYCVDYYYYFNCR